MKIKAKIKDKKSLGQVAEGHYETVYFTNSTEGLIINDAEGNLVAYIDLVLDSYNFKYVHTMEGYTSERVESDEMAIFEKISSKEDKQCTI